VTDRPTLPPDSCERDELAEFERAIKELGEHDARHDSKRFPNLPLVRRLTPAPEAT
jgi:hypothetical protein